jgi:hypothetical protein
VKAITLVLPDDQADRLERAASHRGKTLAELLRIRLIDMFEDLADPFDPRGQFLRERDQELLRRFA